MRGRLCLAVTSPQSVNVLLAPQLNSLVAAGWDVHVVTSPGPIDQDVRDQVNMHQVPMSRAVSPARDLAAIGRMVALLRSLNPDVVVGGTPKAALVAMVAARLVGVPRRIFQVRGARWDAMRGWTSRILIAADRVTAANATDVLAVSPSLADLMVASGACRVRPTLLGAGGSKGVDLELFKTDSAHVFDANSPRLGFLGRLTEDKGIADALAVLDAVSKSRSGAQLCVIGDLDRAVPVGDGLIRRLTNDPAIHWYRSLTPPQVADELRRWDVLVFPSRREGLPNAVIEAAACGVPTVGYRVTGVVDAVRDGSTGFLVEAGDRAALVEAALRCLGPLRTSLRHGSVQWSADNFDAHLVQSHFVEFLADAIRLTDDRHVSEVHHRSLRVKS